MSQVAAHGTPPSALSIVAEDDRGISVVRMSTGLALREATGSYRMLCPALWNDDGTRPTLRLSGGAVVVLGGTGLYLVDAEGSVSSHPDAQAVGPALDIVVLAGRTYALRPHAAGSEIIEVTERNIRSVWRDERQWTAFAAGAGVLALARLSEDDVLDLARVSPEGELLSALQAAAPSGATSVSVRTLGEALYLVVAWSGGRQLGRIEAGQWVAMENALSSIAGPLGVDGGRDFVALDSALSAFPVTPANEPDATTPVSCLGRSVTGSYACTRDGLRGLDAQGLGASLFALDALVPPRLDALSASVRERCDQQWQHFRFDLLSVGIMLQGEVAAQEAGLQDGGLVGNAADGGSHVNATGKDSDAGKPPARALRSGCSYSASTNRAADQTWLGALLLLGWLRIGHARARRAR